MNLVPIATIALVSSVHAGVVAAWDFNGNAGAAAAEWTTFVLGASNSNKVGSLTLTQSATGEYSARTLAPHRFHENDPALLPAGTDEMNDGFDLAGSQDFTLSGLTEDQEYRLQFIGVVTHTSSNNGKKRNLNMTTDAGASTADLFIVPIDTTATTNDAGYSAYLTFIADASGDVVITFGEDGSGNKCVSGLIVEEIGGTEPPEPVEPPVITHTTVLEGGTNLLMTWTSKEGQLFDIVKSEALKSWRIFEENVPASASTQTTYAVALGEGDESQFYQVWSVKDVPPNIILLFADDLGYGDLACYGHPYARTPNLDKLAAEGTLFREFNVTGMTCNPSRTGILTSYHPNSYAYSTSDEGFNQGHLPGGEDHITIMELLNDAGYRTGHFGKWHIGPDDNPGDVTNGMYGIDEIILGGGGGNDPRGRDEEIYQDAINFIVDNQHTNFYINVMGRVTHSPVDPRPELVESAGFANLALDRADFPGQQIQDIFDGVEAHSGNITNSMANYLTEVYYLDQFIGELLAKLDELGLRENTIVAFSSDQGAAVPNYDEHGTPDFEPKEYNLVGWSGGLRGQKHNQHEGGVRSPFILRWPGYVPAGKINTNSNTSALDWLPTLCGIADVTIDPADFQGEDVRDIWEGADRSRTGSQFWNSSMKKDAWRIYFNGGSTNAYELYDLSSDLSETNNLLTVYPDVVDELTVIWADWKENLP